MVYKNNILIFYRLYVVKSCSLADGYDIDISNSKSIDIEIIKNRHKVFDREKCREKEEIVSSSMNS